MMHKRHTAFILTTVCIFALLTGCFGRPGTVDAKGYTALDTVLHSAVPGSALFKQSDFEFAECLQEDEYGRHLYRVNYTSFFGDGTVAYIVTQSETTEDAGYDPLCCYLLKLPTSADATQEEVIKLCKDNGWGNPIDTAALARTLHTEPDFPLLDGERTYDLYNRVNADVAKELGLSSSLSCMVDGLQLYDINGRQVIAIRVDQKEGAAEPQSFICCFALYSPAETPKLSNLVEWKDSENSRDELIAFCRTCGIELPKE